MAAPARDFGRLEGQQEATGKAVEMMRGDIAEIRKDLHELTVAVAGMNAKMDTLARSADPRLTLFGFSVLIAAGAGLYTKTIGEISAVSMVLVAAVIMQHESINKLARTLFRLKEEPDDAGGTKAN